LIELHDGRVRAENRPEGGARFTIELKVDAERSQDADFAPPL
jgi:signal transduction histidine kinase